MTIQSSATENDPALRGLIFGLRWEYAERSDATGPEVFDLDASCIALDREGRVLASVQPGSPADAMPGIRHTGDSRVGGGWGDDERMLIEPGLLPEAVASLILLVTSMSGCAFGRIPAVACCLTDSQTRQTLLEVDLTRLATHNARVVARLTCDGGRWGLTACGG